MRGSASPAAHGTADRDVDGSVHRPEFASPPSRSSRERRDTSGLVVAVEQIVDTREDAIPDAEGELGRIAALLQALSKASRRGARAHPKEGTASTTVRRLDVLPNVSLDVRYLPDEAIPLLDELGKRLERLQDL